MKVIIMRGIPGAGKSSWIAKFHHDNPHTVVRSEILSADHTFINPVTGKYEFDPRKLPRAHDNVLSKFVRLACAGYDEHGLDFVFVDNTNINEWEVAAYYRVAEALGHQVKVVNVWCDVEVAKSRCVHDVPPAKIDMMSSIMHRGIRVGPPWWVFEQVNCPYPAAGVVA